MPKKQPVVKSEAVAATPALPVVRKQRAAAKSRNSSASEAPAPASADRKAPRSRKKADPVSAMEPTVTHRHKKEIEIPSLPAPVSATAVAIPVPYRPNQEEIAKLAYSYYVARGYQPGDPRSDWFRAEQELKARHAASLASLLED